VLVIRRAALFAWYGLVLYSDCTRDYLLCMPSVLASFIRFAVATLRSKGINLSYSLDICTDPVSLKLSAPPSRDDYLLPIPEFFEYYEGGVSLPLGALLDNLGSICGIKSSGSVNILSDVSSCSFLKEPVSPINA